MKKLKQILALSLAVLLLLSTIPALSITAMAQSVSDVLPKIENIIKLPSQQKTLYYAVSANSAYNYTVDGDGNATITKYNHNESTVYIPSEIDGHTVVAIDNSAFEGKAVGYVEIPDTVTTIGYRVFANCSKLTKVSIPNSITSLGTWAFNGSAIESIYIPKALKTCSGYPVFGGCYNLKTVTFEEGITKIIDNLFESCPGIENVSIPDTVTVIGGYAFKDCINLKNVSIPNSLTSVGTWAFGNTAIESIYIPKALKECSYYPIFTGCYNLKTVVFEEGITEIVAKLFKNCPGIESITIPETVTYIGENAFYGCENLKTVNIPDCVTKIDTWAFCECTSLKNAELPKSLTYLGQQAFCLTAIESVTIPKSLKQVGYAAPFNSCSKLKNVVFEDGTTSIIDHMLDSCTGLETVVIPDSVISIGWGAFMDCINLKAVTIPNSVTSINQAAFDDCKSLESVSWTNSVTELGGGVFAGCINLKSIEIPKKITKIGTGVFSSSGLETIEIPTNWENIPDNCFYNCVNLEEIRIPSNIKNIYSDAFNSCSKLEKIYFENSDLKLDKIYSAAFANTPIKEIIIPETVSYLGEYAFKNCTALEKVYIPQSTKSIGQQAFMGCENLTDLTISDYSITEIKADTFKDCPLLAKVVLPKGLTKISSQAFMNCTGLTEVYIPESVTSISNTTFSYPDKTTIYGKTGSYAESFANDNEFKFVDKSVTAEGFALIDGIEYVEMDRGTTYRAQFEFYPEDATDFVTLTANNSNVTINGMDIYARYTGDTVITTTTSGGLSYEFTVHIRDAKGISITSKPTKLSYIMGDTLDLTGMAVQVTYNDGAVKDVTDYTVTGFDSSVEGSCTVTVQWISAYGSTYKTTFTVDIIDPRPKLTGIVIHSLPDKIYYERRESLNLEGFILNATYTDGSAVAVTDYTVSGYNALKNGAQTVTVTYGDYSTTFVVYVGIKPTGITVTPPSKTSYTIGEVFDANGMNVSLNYSDGTSKLLTEGFTVTGFDSNTLGTKTITVTYDEFTYSFEVEVSENVMEPDFTGDGQLNNKDLGVLMQYINGWNVEIDITAADVNGDGAVNNKDYAVLIRYINGWNVELK